MKKQFYFKIGLIVLVLFFETLQSQNYNYGFNNAYYQLGTTPDDIRSTNEIEEEIREILNKSHKVYLTKDYASANVSGIDENLLLRYNLFMDEMELKRGEEIIYLKKREGREIIFQNNSKKYLTYEIDNELRYFQVLEDGKNKLLRSKVVTFSESKKAATSYHKDKPADFKRENDTHFIKFEDDNSIVEIPTRKKSFLKIFKDKSEVIKKFVEDKNINTKKVEDLKKVVDYYNSL